MCPKHLLQKLAHRNSASAFLMIAALERKGKLGPLLYTCCLIQMLLWILKGGDKRWGWLGFQERMLIMKLEVSNRE